MRPSERWLLTYADMITLLMAFFIMMYAMSIINLGKFQELAVSVRSGFGGDARQMSSAQLNLSEPGGKVSILPADNLELMSRIAQRVSGDLKKAGLTRGVTVTVGKEGVTVRLLADGLLFDRGDAALKPRTRRILDEVSRTLSDIPNRIRIEGHTCDLPIRSARFPSNWELSAGRAASVLRYLVEAKDLTPGRLAIAGYADTRPLVPNANEQSRRKNRRVDILILTPPERRRAPAAAANATAERSEPTHADVSAKGG
ncbi:MAG: flagellar motor protein MotB [Armatimonadota bacterium]